MGGPYRSYITANGKTKIEDISKLDARTTSIQWLNVRYDKRAQAQFYKMAKRPTKDKLGDYIVDNGSLSGDLNNMPRSSKMYMYEPGERYNSVTEEFEQVKNEISDEKLQEIKKQNAGAFKQSNGEPGAKPINYHVSGSRFMKSKPGYFVDKTGIQKMTTAENIQRQTGLETIDEDLGKTFETILEENGIEDEAEKAEIREISDAMMNGKNIFPDFEKTASKDRMRSPASIIEEACDPEFRKRFKAVNKVMSDIDKQYAARERTGLNVSTNFTRATPMLMDISGTKEAEEHNIQMMEMVNCQAGQALIGTQNIKKLLDQGFDNFIMPDDKTSMEMFEKHGTDVQLGFLAVNAAFGVHGVELDPLVAQEYAFNKTVYETASNIHGVGKFYTSGAAGLYDPNKVTPEDIANLSVMNRTDAKMGKCIEDSFISYMDRSRVPGYAEATAELTKNGIIGKNSKYLNAIMTTKDSNGKEIKERIPFAEAVEKYSEIFAAKKNPGGPQPDFKIDFVEKTPEEKKAIDAAYGNPAKVKPVPNPGAVYGQGLQDDFKEFQNSFKDLNLDEAKKIPSFAATLETIDKLSKNKFDTQEAGLKELRELVQQTHKAIRETDRSNTLKGDDKKIVQSILRTTTVLGEEKIGSVALENYAKSQNIDISKVYSDKTIAKSGKFIEQKRAEKQLKNIDNSVNSSLKSDVEAYKSGELPAEQLADDVAMYLAKKDLDNILDKGMSQESIQEYREALNEDNFAKKVTGYLEGTNRQALATAIESLSPKQLDALGKGKLEGKDLEDFVEAYQYSQKLLSPEYQQKMEEEARRAEEEFAKEQAEAKARKDAEAKAKKEAEIKGRDEALDTGLKKLDDTITKRQGSIGKTLDDKNMSSKDKQTRLEKDLATMITAKTMSQTLEKVGQHMSKEDVELFLSTDTRVNARKDVLNSASFKKLCSTLGPEDYAELAKNPEKLDSCIGDLQKIDMAMVNNRQQKEPEKQQKAPSKQQGPSK